VIAQAGGGLEVTVTLPAAGAPIAATTDGSA